MILGLAVRLKEWDYGNRNESEKTGKGAQAG